MGTGLGCYTMKCGAAVVLALALVPLVTAYQDGHRGLGLLHDADMASKKVEVDAQKIATDIRQFEEAFSENMKKTGQHNLAKLAQKVVDDKATINVGADEMQAEKVSRDAIELNGKQGTDWELKQAAEEDLTENESVLRIGMRAAKKSAALTGQMGMHIEDFAKITGKQKKVMKQDDLSPEMRRDMRALNAFGEAMELIAHDERKAVRQGEKEVHKLEPGRRLLARHRQVDASPELERGIAALSDADNAGKTVESDAQKVATDIAKFAGGIKDNMNLKGHNDIQALARQVISDKSSVNIQGDEKKADHAAQTAVGDNVNNDLLEKASQKDLDTQIAAEKSERDAAKFAIPMVRTLSTHIDDLKKIDGNQGRVVQFSDFDHETQDFLQGMKRVEADMVRVTKGEEESYQNGESIV